MNTSALRELQVIPGIGPRVAWMLLNLAICDINDLRSHSSYQKLRALRWQQFDQCGPFTLCFAVCFSSEPRHDPDRSKRWNR